jgi:hypothetical protein
VDPDAKALLTNVRQGLLRLHKTLLDWERGHYERTHGRQSSADLLNAFLQDPHFAWLRPMSQLIVRIDEMLEDAARPTAAAAQGVLAELKALTSPGDSGKGDAQRYARALEENPETVFAHRDLMALAGSRQDDRRPSR